MASSDDYLAKLQICHLLQSINNASHRIVHSETDIDNRVVLLSVVNTESDKVLNRLKLALVIIGNVSVLILVHQLNDTDGMRVLYFSESFVRLIQL